MKNWKVLVEWFGAVVISFLIANFLIVFYFYDPGWITRDEGATRGIYEPGSVTVRADEGYTITGIDENGYINQSADLIESGYILNLGNSQSNGNNVMPENKFVALLNAKFQQLSNDNRTHVYNMSVGGYDFGDIVQGFEAAVSEFPDSRAIVIQIGTTELPIEKLESYKEQRSYSSEASAEFLVTNQDITQKLKNVVKDYFPLVTYVAELKLSKVDLAFEQAFWQDFGTTTEDGIASRENTESLEKVYRETLNGVLSYLRETYQGKIIILYLPSTELLKDGTMHVREMWSDKVFSDICSQNDIVFCNMGEIYQREYEEMQVLPYGFANTKPASGHLNKYGHKMIADALYLLLKE